MSQRRARIEECSDCGELLVGFEDDERHDCEP